VRLLVSFVITTTPVRCKVQQLLLHSQSRPGWSVDFLRHNLALLINRSTPFITVGRASGGFVPGLETGRHAMLVVIILLNLMYTL